MAGNPYLSFHLKRAGLMTGSSKKMTRHSSLGVLKKCLLNGKQFSVGYKSYNNFGSALHHLFLLGKPGRWKLTPLEKRMRECMILKLNNHPIVKSVMSHCTVREKKRKTKLFSVPFHFTPDAHGTVKGSDLKSTACTNQKDFEQSAREYGYFRQGDTYSLALKSLRAANIKEFWIFGSSKKYPHDVFPVLIQNHPEHMKYVRQEFHLLLYIYKHYGNPVIYGKEKTTRKKK